MKKKIFVYGTLRQGMYNYERYLKNENSFKQYAYVKGTLYTIQGVVYPALLLEGNAKILGEIHEISEEKLNDIDQLEGYISQGNVDNDYDKILCDIYNEQDEIIEQLPVYVFNMRKPENQITLGRKIICNDYVKFIQTK